MTEEICNHDCGECKYYMRPYCTYSIIQKEPRYENRLNRKNIKFQTLNPAWDNKKQDAYNIFEMINIMNQQQSKIETLETITRSALYDLNTIDNYENYSLTGHWGNFTLHSIKEDKMILTPTGVVDRLNKLSKQNQLLKLKNNNLWQVLQDFIKTLNYLQANYDEYWLKVARDMILKMGVELKE